MCTWCVCILPLLCSDGISKIKRCEVVKLERIENVPLWKAYWHRKNEMVDSYHAHNVRVKPLVPCSPQLHKKIAPGKIPAPPITVHSGKVGWWQQQAAPGTVEAEPVHVSEWPKPWDQKLDKNELLDQTLNEVFLYHGTKHSIVNIIATHGFDERVAVR